MNFKPPKCGCGLKAYTYKNEAEWAVRRIKDLGTRRNPPTGVRQCSRGLWHLVDATEPATLARNTTLKPGGRLRQRSAATAKVYREERVPLVESLLEERSSCEIQWDDGCQGRAMDVDEILSRAQGGSILDLVNLQTTCRYCHDKKHQNPAEAKLRGFTRSAGGAR